MKLLPEVPTEEMIEAGRKVFNFRGEILSAAAYKAMYAAAPEVKDEPVAWLFEVKSEFLPSENKQSTLHKDASIACPGEGSSIRNVEPLYLRPSPRIPELEKEVERLRQQLATARADVEKQFCEAIIATQEPSKTTGHLTCDSATLLAYYNDHKPKN